MSIAPIRVAVTGAAGAIGYSLLFRIAAGELFGPNQPVLLHLMDIEPALSAMRGIVMELEDCAYPLLQGLVATANLDEGFRGVNWALLVGSVSRKPGLERKDLLGINGIDRGLICSFPARRNGSKLEIVPGLPVNEFSRAKINASVAELKEEQALAAELGLLAK